VLYSAKKDKLTNHLPQRLLFSKKWKVGYRALLPIYVSIDKAFDSQIKLEVCSSRLKQLLVSLHFVLFQARRKITILKSINSLQISKKIYKILHASVRSKTYKTTVSLSHKLLTSDFTLQTECFG
jgi:hypothetical protein